MKAITLNPGNGELSIEEVPPPVLHPQGMLVQVRSSLISLGTERAIIDLAHKNPLAKARQRPDLARKVINKARQEGLWSTYQVVRNLISTPLPLGYSSAGEVLEVGDRATEFHPGERVACAGLGFANHAEINYVPRTMATRIPDGVTYEQASFVTLGAIAMQGIRLARIELGDKVAVLGLGLVGQLSAQLARCAGATVFASDLDPGKLELATSLGAHHAALNDQHLPRSIQDITAGHGVDAVLICAATPSHELVQRAAEVARLKGRVIVIGDVGMNLERRAFFEKELELIVSRSYGPGRYDPLYEVHGQDYPYAYVRWTEGRNMAAFLELIARQDVQVDPLITHRFAIEEAEAAYELVTGKMKEPTIAIVLHYESQEPVQKRIALKRDSRTPPTETLQVGVIGAGQFAKAVLLPAFARHRNLRLRAFCTASGLTSKDVASRYQADYCTSEAEEILEDPEINTVLIATRHNLHAPLALKALQAGKAVFVEKPLAMTGSQLAELVEGLANLEAPRLMVGFNRRFSPLMARCREVFARDTQPVFIQYRVNAGYFPPDSWVYDPMEGGGRIVGEVCHFVDLVQYLTASAPARVAAEALKLDVDPALQRDNLTITLSMQNGAVGTIHYLANGDPSVPKEYMEVYGSGRTAILDNYRSLALHQNNRKRTYRLMNQAKGHDQEVAAFVHALQQGDPMPIDLESLIITTQTTFLVHKSLSAGKPVPYEPPLATTSDDTT